LAARPAHVLSQRGAGPDRYRGARAEAGEESPTIDIVLPQLAAHRLGLVDELVSWLLKHQTLPPLVKPGHLVAGGTCAPMRPGERQKSGSGTDAAASERLVGFELWPPRLRALEAYLNAMVV